MVNNGRYCDNCGSHLDEEDYDSYGSWSYKCSVCGFHYRHHDELTVRQQVYKFNEDRDHDTD